MYNILYIWIEKCLEIGIKNKGLEVYLRDSEGRFKRYTCKKLTINPTVMEKEKYRNMTISLKVAAEEKIMLKRLAEKHKVSLSEFMYNLVMCFKNQYEYIGMLSPKEEKLAENLRLEKKKNAKLGV